MITYINVFLQLGFAWTKGKITSGKNKVLIQETYRKPLSSVIYNYISSTASCVKNCCLRFQVDCSVIVNSTIYCLWQKVEFALLRMLSVCPLVFCNFNRGYPGFSFFLLQTRTSTNCVIYLFTFYLLQLTDNNQAGYLTLSAPHATIVSLSR